MKINQPVTGRECTFGEKERIISTTDTRGIITGYNETFFRISGFSAEELDGKNHNVVRHPDMPPAAFADLWQTVKQNRSWMGIVKNRCKNGDHYWVDAFVTPINDKGQIVEFQSVRCKPSAELIERAEKVYRRINDKKRPYRYQLSLANKLSLAAVASPAPTLAAAYIAPNMVWMGALASMALCAGLIRLLIAPLQRLSDQARDWVANPLMSYI